MLLKENAELKNSYSAATGKLEATANRCKELERENKLFKKEREKYQDMFQRCNNSLQSTVLLLKYESCKILAIDRY